MPIMTSRSFWYGDERAIIEAADMDGTDEFWRVGASEPMKGSSFVELWCAIRATRARRRHGSTLAMKGVPMVVIAEHSSGALILV
jgi:hypothetical protein